MLLTQPRITIDLNAIRDNYLALKKQAPDVEVCPMMKGYGYGLGLVEVVRPLVENGCEAVYVSFINEGILLRKAFPKLQINVVNGIFEGTEQLF
jgi:alanine racemase